MTRKEYEKRLGEIEKLHDDESYHACVRECGAMFEVALREVLVRLVQALQSQGIAFPEPLKEFANLKRDKQSLAPLTRCMRDDEVQKRFRAYYKLSSPRLRRISWRGVKEIRNLAVHDQDASNIDQEDSLHMKHWIRIFLEETKLVGKKKLPKIARRVGRCTGCKEPLTPEWNFCPKCGTCIRLSCISCASVLDPKFKICPYCETPVRGASQTGAKALHEYEMLFKGAFLDQVITPDERELLEKKRLEMGLTAADAEEVHRRCIPQNIREYQRLVEAASSDGSINDLERALLERKVVELGVNPKTAKSIEDQYAKA
jgi:RNA polymerase subunit RPABC4/transcription elongation factor Spt4